MTQKNVRQASRHQQTLAPHTPEPWYGQHLFVRQADPEIISLGRARIRTLDWKPPAKIRITACMLCATRPIERVGNQALLRRLWLNEMADSQNAKLAFRVNEVAKMCTSEPGKDTSMSDRLLNGLVWASTCFFMAAMAASYACFIVRLMFLDGYERGKKDATPLRAKNGWFIGRSK